MRRASILFLLACLVADLPASHPAWAQSLSGGNALPHPACGKNTDVFFSFPYLNGDWWSYSTGGVGDLTLLGQDPAQTPFADLRLGDFNGDGISDVFTATGTDWRYSSEGQSAWQVLQNSTLPLSELAFGDFDGDGVTDVFDANGSQWRFSSAGTQPWQVLQSSNLLLNSLAFGDFDGDGVTDVFTVAGSRWLVSPSGAQPWQTLQTQDLLPLTLSELRFSDFDGDGKTDVFTSYSGIWYLSSGGTSVLKQIGSSNVPLSDLRFGDFDGDGKTDVFSIGSGYWRYSSAGNSPWRPLSSTASPHDNLNIDDLGFGNFDMAGERAPLLLYKEADGNGPQEDIVSADFNADGLPDLAFAHSNNRGVGTLVNRTSIGDLLPSFGFGPAFLLQNAPYRLAVGDFNADRRPDLAILSRASQSASSLNIALNGTGVGAQNLTLALSPDIPLDKVPDSNSILAIDINADGLDDLAVTSSISDSVNVLLNQSGPGNANPIFANPLSFAVGANPWGLAAGDFNGDGRPDLAAASYDASDISLLLNQTIPGSGAVNFAGQIPLGTPANPEAVISADFNADGRPDLAATTLGRDRVFVFLNETQPKAATLSFSDPLEFAITAAGGLGGSNPHELAALDLDRDGRLDLALGNLTNSSLAVLFNATPPGASVSNFISPTQFYAGPDPLALAAGDFNQDGLPDLAATQDTNNISLLTNQTQPAALSMQGGSGQSARVGEPFSSPLSVKVSDACGRGLPGVQVAFTVPPSGPGASLSETVAITGKDGLASVEATANYQAGSYAVTATISNTVTQLKFELSNTASRLYLPLIETSPVP